MGLLDAAAGAVSGTSNQTPTKLIIQVESENSNGVDPFQGATSHSVMFNPVTLARDLQAAWAPGPLLNGSPQLHFTSTPLTTMKSVVLFFDTTEDMNDAKPPCSAGDDVRTLTQPFSDLTRIQPQWHRPPLCQLIWGSSDPNGNSWFVGVATSVTESFTYFAPNGTPLRAQLTCSFLEFNPAQTELHSTDVHKSHTVKRGDTLTTISKERLHDVSLWRVIAKINGITDPLALRPGQVLHIPTVQRR